MASAAVFGAGVLEVVYGHGRQPLSYVGMIKKKDGVEDER